MRCVRPSKADAKGFTLFETMVASGVGALAFTAVATMMLFGARSTAALGNYADLDRRSRETLDQMTTDIRQANKVLSCTNNQLQIQAVDISYGTTNPLTYTYDPTNQTLTRIYTNSTNILLTGIISNSLSFSMYLRNPIGGDVTTNYLTTDPTQCKIVQLSWICSRPIFGASANTESVQTAKVVIRKE
jgi:hypothetical protein